VRCGTSVVVHYAGNGGVNGLLADFFSAEDVAKKTLKLLDAKDDNAALRVAARATVLDRYALHKVLPLHRQLVLDVGQGMVPPPAAAEILKMNPVEPYRESFWHGA
jgi:hypothetical protein